MDPALIRPGRIDKKIQYKLATRAQATALFMRFYPEAFITLRSERSLTADKSTHLTPSEKRSFLRSLSEQFATAVPEYEFSTAELQGFLLSCKQDPERAVKQVAKWVEDEINEKATRAKREEERKARAKEKKEAMEVKFLQGGLARLGVNIGDTNGGDHLSSGSTASPVLPQPGPVVSGPSPTATETTATHGVLPQPTNTVLPTVISPDMSTASAAVPPIMPLPVTKPLVNGDT